LIVQEARRLKIREKEKQDGAAQKEPEKANPWDAPALENAG